MGKRVKAAEVPLVKQWVKNHRGVLTVIAVECGVSPQFVQQVAYGYATVDPGHPVETKLKNKGWPGAIRRKSA